VGDGSGGFSASRAIAYACGAIRRHQTQSDAIGRNRTQSDAIGRNRTQSDAIGAMACGAISGPQWSLEAIRTQSAVLRMQSEAISAPVPPAGPQDAIRGHQRACAARRSSSETRRKSRWRRERPMHRIACRYDASDATGFPSSASSCNPEAACTHGTLAKHHDTIRTHSERTQNSITTHSGCNPCALSTQSGRNQDAIRT
jgi:hypothetical protein